MILKTAFIASKSCRSEKYIQLAVPTPKTHIDLQHIEVVYNTLKSHMWFPWNTYTCNTCEIHVQIYLKSGRL